MLAAASSSRTACNRLAAPVVRSHGTKFQRRVIITTPLPGCRRLLAPAVSESFPSHSLVNTSESDNKPREVVFVELFKMARPHNFIPSVLLVLLGAWAGSGHQAQVFQSLAVWSTACASGGVAVASVVINDYFDFKSGVDTINAPLKPLPQGIVPPDVAILFSSSIYVAVLCMACFLEHPLVRAVVALSAGITLLYTPIFKRLTAIKNATVAAIIVLAPISGALASGAAWDSLARMLAPSMLVFAGFVYREILMDINDREGDAVAGVTTLPVLLGPKKALLLGCVLVLLATLGASYTLVLSAKTTAAASIVQGAAWLSAEGAGLVLVALYACQLVGTSLHVWRENFEAGIVSTAIEECLKPLGLGLVLMAILA